MHFSLSLSDVMTSLCLSTAVSNACSPHLQLSPTSSLAWKLSLTSSLASLHELRHVVFCLSDFTHSRYYHQVPVNSPDTHQDRAVSHLAGNDGCYLVRLNWRPQMTKSLCQTWPCHLGQSCGYLFRRLCPPVRYNISNVRRLTRQESLKSVIIKQNVEYLNLCFICLIISSVVFHSFSNTIIN